MNSKMSDGKTRWACLFPNEDPEYGVEEETEHLFIITDPRNRGVIFRYCAKIVIPKGPGVREYFLRSDRNEFTNLACISYNHGYPEAMNDSSSSSSSSKVPRFYPLKLKEPLLPQFMKIYENVKLCLTFS